MKDEINTTINELERRRFYLSMKDFWTNADYAADRKLQLEILELKKALAANA